MMPEQTISDMRLKFDIDIFVVIQRGYTLMMQFAIAIEYGHPEQCPIIFLVIIHFTCDHVILVEKGFNSYTGPSGTMSQAETRPGQWTLSYRPPPAGRWPFR